MHQFQKIKKLNFRNNNKKLSYDVHIDCDNFWVYEKEFGCKLIFDNKYFYEVSLVRILDILNLYDIKGTFFIIGKDLLTYDCENFCKLVVSSGHSIGNHTYSHYSNYGKLNQEERDTEILKCHEIIVNKLGVQPKAFRAPGYSNKPGDWVILNKLGYTYDSSTLPGPTTLIIKLLTQFNEYYKNKELNVINNLVASTKIRKLKFQTDNYFYTVPIGVLPFIRLPIHSSFLFLFGVTYLKISFMLIKFLNKTHNIILLHGIDLTDDIEANKKNKNISITKCAYKKRSYIYENLFKIIMYECINTNTLLNKEVH